MGLSSLMLPQWLFNLFFLAAAHFPPHLFLSRCIYLFNLPRSGFCPHSSPSGCPISAEEFAHSSAAVHYLSGNIHFATVSFQIISNKWMEKVWMGKWAEGLSEPFQFLWYCHYTVGKQKQCLSTMMSWNIGVGWGLVIQLQQTLSKLKILHEIYRIFIGEQLVTFSKSLLRVLMVL